MDEDNITDGDSEDGDYGGMAGVGEAEGSRGGGQELGAEMAELAARNVAEVGRQWRGGACYGVVK